MTQTILTAPASAHDSVYQELATTWTQTVEGPEPEWLPAVAVTLTREPEFARLLPDREVAHQHLVAAVDAASRAHLRALAERAQAEQDWQSFRNDVRRRAAHAVNAGHICRDGTNAALREFGIDELRVEYRVDLLVPVTTYLRASDTDDAYEQAADRVRDELNGDGLDIDTDGIRYDDATVADEDVD
jgi:hypothetical protein